MFEMLVVFLSVLWIADLYQTLIITKRFGNRVEENPFVRFLLKYKRIDFVIFKLIDLSFVITIMYFVNAQNIWLAGNVLTAFVVVYFFTVVHNYHVYKNIYRAY